MQRNGRSNYESQMALVHHRDLCIRFVLVVGRRSSGNTCQPPGNNSAGRGDARARLFVRVENSPRMSPVGTSDAGTLAKLSDDAHFPGSILANANWLVPIFGTDRW
jgi:hypothetical protein